MKTFALAALALTLATPVLAFNPQPDPPESAQSQTHTGNPAQQNVILPSRNR
jgi:hypothetical protein